MRKLFRLFLIFALFSPAGRAAETPMPTVTVMADHSLSMMVAEIARNYSRGKQAMVNTSFLSQKIQQEQISEGASADILITSKEAWIEDLKLQGLIDIHSQAKLAEDRLVLIGSADTSLVAKGAGRFPAFEIIKAGGGEPNLLIGNPETLMEGVYAKQAMRNLGLAEDLEPSTLYVKRLDQMFDAVLNAQGFGICFQSSVRDLKGIKIIDTIPESAHKPIIYYAVVIAGDNMNQARNFMKYLQSAEVNKLFTRYGFVAD